ncbi:MULTISPECIES: TetR/AcrR family transcriptional regulator [Nitratireductor]|jgi:AcrR family transcriptional regulator|uniref:Regulatory protein TetR n=1 Tax=Nitratireductor basaltis TaxID=472175 RepID=A0A084UCB7_9HYPH|nr:TetR/AcrR family transcriptional regulator [Nitratireductor basaltis]KFB10603.1 Regulatory protein TetR [Nitratireductor basaltis]
MARTAGSDGEKTEALLRSAALELIARHGFDAMSMRQLSAKVGVQAAALYRYFPTKETLLFTLMKDHMEALQASWEAARPESDVSARLSAFVDNHIRFHIERRHATHVSNMELRSLSPERLTEIMRMRTNYEKELRQILRDGAQQGLFRIDDVTLTGMAIIQMITGVIVWFRPGERFSVDEVAQNYHRMTLRLVGAAHAEDSHV